MNNFAVITKAEQDVAKAKAHLSVLKQKINRKYIFMNTRII